MGKKYLDFLSSYINIIVIMTMEMERTFTRAHSGCTRACCGATEDLSLSHTGHATIMRRSLMQRFHPLFLARRPACKGAVFLVFLGVLAGTNPEGASNCPLAHLALDRAREACPASLLLHNSSLRADHKGMKYTTHTTGRDRTEQNGTDPNSKEQRTEHDRTGQKEQQRSG